MNCRRFVRILAGFQEGTLSSGERLSAEAHLKNCSACRQLLEIACGSVDIIPEDRREALTRSILDRTSGSVCSGVESRLWDFLSGGFDAEDSQLISSHLEHCAGCRSAAKEMSMMQADLPSLAEIEPGESFTRDVVNATSGWRPRRPGWQTQILTWWNRAVQRPRFSFEAAYIGALALFFACSIFMTVRNDVSGKDGSAAARTPSKYLFSIWTGAKGTVANQLSEFASTTAAKRQIAVKSLGEMFESIHSAPAPALDKKVQSVKMLRRRMAGALVASWTRLFHRIMQSKSRQAS